MLDERVPAAPVCPRSTSPTAPRPPPPLRGRRPPSIRLTSRKKEVASKPTTMHSWSSEEYAAIHAASTAARTLVRQKSAYPACPFASDDSAYDSSDRDSTCLSPSDSGICLLLAQPVPEPPEKVGAARHCCCSGAGQGTIPWRCECTGA